MIYQIVLPVFGSTLAAGVWISLNKDPCFGSNWMELEPPKKFWR